MRVKFWGTRGTRPTPGRRTLRYGGNTTCIEVRDKDENLIIIDSGSGIAELGSGARPGQRAAGSPADHAHAHGSHPGLPVLLAGVRAQHAPDDRRTGGIREVAAGGVRGPDGSRVLSGPPRPHAGGHGVHRAQPWRDLRGGRAADHAAPADAPDPDLRLPHRRGRHVFRVRDRQRDRAVCAGAERIAFRPGAVVPRRRPACSRRPVQPRGVQNARGLRALDV